MNVLCAACGRALAVPPDKAAIPNLKARCQCGHVFLVAEAARAPQAGAPAPSPRPPTASAPRPVASPAPAVTVPVRPEPGAATAGPASSASQAASRPATGALPRVTARAEPTSPRPPTGAMPRPAAVVAGAAVAHSRPTGVAARTTPSASR
jgi:hypothetical protein